MKYTSEWDICLYLLLHLLYHKTSVKFELLTTVEKSWGPCQEPPDCASQLVCDIHLKGESFK